LTAPFEKTTIKIAGAAVLAPLSVILQVLPPLFVTPWFMRIDLVAVPWVLCWILFGFKSALLSLLISVPIVGALGPFAGGWVGAIMKSVASVWMFTVPALFTWRKSAISSFLANKKLYVFASLLAIVIRDVVTITFNLYFAIPVFFNMTPEQVIAFFSNPRFLSFIGHSLGLIGLSAYIGEVAFWNTIQGIIDMYAALIIGHIVLRRFLGAVKA
jgi:riboflavin transporter FmnP